MGSLRSRNFNSDLSCALIVPAHVGSRASFPGSHQRDVRTPTNACSPHSTVRCENFSSQLYPLNRSLIAARSCFYPRLLHRTFPPFSRQGFSKVREEASRVQFRLVQTILFRYRWKRRRSRHCRDRGGSVPQTNPRYRDGNFCCDGLVSFLKEKLSRG